MSRLQIGAAQFGNIYGLTNNSRILAPTECWSILDLALSNGIDEVDTSPTYGQSSSIISKYRGGSLKITSKIKIKGLGREGILEELSFQRKKLCDFHTLHTILIHDFALLDESELISLQKIIDEVGEIMFGISVYSSWEITQASRNLVGIKTIQFPINILNQEFLPMISSEQKGDYRFVARSLMLQGAIDWESERNRFRSHSSILKLRTIATALGLRPIELVVAFAKKVNPDSILFGFASEKQLQDFLDIWLSDMDLQLDFSNFSSSDLDLIDPRRW